MTGMQFRKLALKLPEAVESEHMGHPDFRVKGKIFATLNFEEDRGMVKLTPEQQAEYTAAQPDVFTSAAGAWGRQGCTLVQLADAKALSIRKALRDAWRNVAEKKPSGNKKRRR
jgi:hypothetical protein